MSPSKTTRRDPGDVLLDKDIRLDSPEAFPAKPAPAENASGPSGADAALCGG